MPTLTGIDLLRTDKTKRFGRVAVIDRIGDIQGVSVAAKAAQQSDQVDFITPLARPGEQIDIPTWRTSYEALVRAGVTFRPLTEVETVQGGTILAIEGFHRKVELGPYDALIEVAVPEVDDHLCAGLAESGVEIHLVGDGFAPRDLETAVFEGALAGRSL